MAFLTLDMGDKTHSTGIALLARIVQTLLHRQINHGIPQSNRTEHSKLQRKQDVKKARSAGHATSRFALHPVFARYILNALLKQKNDDTSRHTYYTCSNTKAKGLESYL
jgi:hypothetical protein